MRSRRLDAVPALLTLLRVAAGAIVVVVAVGKFADHAGEAADFRRYGIPWAGVAVYVVGAVEIVAGALLVLGRSTRAAAVAMGVVLLGAIVTAGRVEGGAFNLVLAPALLGVMVLTAVCTPSRSVRRPGRRVPG